ncbi:MAG: guanylate kinase [Armatimonadetes bacterium]|nr:guanylate kinase [Armatimonadota bacterium]MDE2205199.1 guanylate kinase [Armatimonadota bacterium]
MTTDQSAANRGIAWGRCVRSAGRLFVLSGPSGVGKDTLFAQSRQQLSQMERSVSCTTRKPRLGERDGVDYHFWSEERFSESVSSGDFLESAEYGGNWYGTLRDPVVHLLSTGIDVMLIIEVKGALKARASIPDAVLIYVAPPSFAELRRRLENRPDFSAEKIAARLAIAVEELASVPEYDYLIVNQQLDAAAAQLSEVVRSERLRIDPVAAASLASGLQRELVAPRNG